MKQWTGLTPALGLAIAVSICTVLLPASASASLTNYTWTGGGGTGEWSNGANWQGGSAPSGTVGTISFPAAACTSASTDNCQSDENISGLTASTLSIVTPTAS